MTFEQWLNTKRPMFEEMFPMVQWPAIHEFLLEVYNVGYEAGKCDNDNISTRFRN